jgi:hypothetical protein
MSDLPETRDLFYPQDPTTVHVGTEQGVRLGRDLGADIVVLDSGAVVAVTESGGALLVNSSLPQYRESLTSFATSLTPTTTSSLTSSLTLKHGSCRSTVKRTLRVTTGS